MSELPGIDPLDLQLEQQVFEAGKVIRAGQLVTSQRLADQAERLRVRTGTNEVALADETEQLKARMTWLHEHPRLKRIIGRTAAVGIERGAVYQLSDIISTKPLDDGTILKIREGHLLVSGLVFWQFYQKVNQTLFIDKQFRDETTGAIRSRKLYTLYPYDSETGPRVQIHGAPFDEYRGRMRRQVFERYADGDASLQRFFGYYSDYPGTSDGRRRGSFDTNCIFNSQDIKTAHRLSDKISDAMEPGGAWEYPDEMFLTPLTIVRQMNMLLGQKQKK